jgi:1-acyl-sn-glycerol-3-phosphate acyltransferase
VSEREIERSQSLDRWGRSPERGSQTRLFMAAYRSWFRVEWEGLENIPAEGGALLVSNHAGMMPVDGGVVLYGIEEELGRRVYSLAHHGFWRFPFAGRFLNQIGGVVGHPENAQRLLKEEGALVVVFPEGEKGPVKPTSERYRLQRFGRGGFVETAMRAGVPIIPIALMGTEDTTPVVGRIEVAGYRYPITLNALLLGPVLGAVAFLPAKIRARALPAVHFDEAPDQQTYSRSRMMDSAEAIRGDLQQALDEMLERRKSRWLG